MNRVPEFFAYQNDGNFIGYFLRLDKCQYFECLVQSPKPSGKEDVSPGGVREHQFPDKEIVETGAFFHVRINSLFHGQLNVDSDGFAVAFHGSPVSRFHYSWSAAGNNRKVVFGQHRTELSGFFIPAVAFRKSGRTEKCDRSFEIGQKLPTFNKLGHNAKNSQVKRGPEITLYRLYFLGKL